MGEGRVLTGPLWNGLPKLPTPEADSSHCLSKFSSLGNHSILKQGFRVTGLFRRGRKFLEESGWGKWEEKAAKGRHVSKPRTAMGNSR